MATVVVHLQRSSVAGLHFPGTLYRWTTAASAFFLAGIAVFGVLLLPRRPPSKRVRTGLGSAVLLAGAGLRLSQMKALAQERQPGRSPTSSRPQDTAATLDRMVKDGKTPRKLAQYLFDARGCKECHTVGHEGKLGFTKKGEERAQSFEGCVPTLKPMSIIAKVPEAQRSPTQRNRAQRFEEFGCTACHQLTPGKMA